MRERYWDGAAWSEERRDVPPKAPKRHRGRNILLGVGALIIAIIVIAAVADSGNNKPKTKTAATSAPATAAPTTAAAPSVTTAATAPPVTTVPAPTTVPPTTAPGVQSNSLDKKNPPAADVTITSCSIDSIGDANANLTILNHSSKSSDYIIQVGFFNPAGVRVDDGYGLENDVPSGGAVETTATGFGNNVAPITCKLVSVDRNASDS
jgi:hypothetical protein